MAGGYSAVRPGYPDDVVAFAVGGADGATRPLRVLDLAAGTGLLTAPIVAAGHDVVAVEPAAGMLAQLAAQLPSVTARAGSAKSIPVADDDVDVVTAGQAAHWFDPGPTAAELRRVLRPGGAVTFVWNMRDDRVAWSAELDALLTQAQVERFAAVSPRPSSASWTPTCRPSSPSRCSGRPRTTSSRVWPRAATSPPCPSRAPRRLPRRGAQAAGHPSRHARQGGGRGTAAVQRLADAPRRNAR